MLFVLFRAHWMRDTVDDHPGCQDQNHCFQKLFHYDIPRCMQIFGWCWLLSCQWHSVTIPAVAVISVHFLQFQTVQSKSNTQVSSGLLLFLYQIIFQTVLLRTTYIIKEYKWLLDLSKKMSPLLLINGPQNLLISFIILCL